MILRRRYVRTSTPVGRVTPLSFYSPGGEHPVTLGRTWLEAESFAYPRGGFTRRAYVEIRRNPNSAAQLPYGYLRVVRCSIPDTYFTIPARLRYRGRTYRGYISVPHDCEHYTFTPEADE